MTSAEIRRLLQSDAVNNGVIFKTIDCWCLFTTASYAGTRHIYLDFGMDMPDTFKSPCLKLFCCKLSSTAVSGFIHVAGKKITLRVPFKQMFLFQSYIEISKPNQQTP